MDSKVADSKIKVSRLRASVVCVCDSRLLVFKAIDPSSKAEYFFLPGGKIELTEKPSDCAQRETLEETGFNVNVVSPSEIIEKYVFQWDGKEIFCQTHFFRAELKGDPQKPLPVNDASYNKGALWLPLQEVDDQFKYSKTIWKAIKDLIVYPSPK